MLFQSLGLGGVTSIRPDIKTDNRGKFIKNFEWDCFRGSGFYFHVVEQFFTVSRKGVLRGMHFQTPPFGHNKMVTCVAGKVLDVMVDLRGDGFGNVTSVVLDGKYHDSVFIPEGIAHGFLSLADDSCVMYNVDKGYAPHNDCGVRWDSINFDWPVLDNYFADTRYIVSERDQNHPLLADFQSPWNRGLAD